MTFRYSGSKTRLLKHLPPPVQGTFGQKSTIPLIIEPFAGSLAYSMHYRPEAIVGAEASAEVRGLWDWLRSDATIEDLTRLESLRPVEKIDAREFQDEHSLTDAETTLIRLTISGAYVGQLSSWVLYPQHNINFDKLKLALPLIKRALVVVFDDYRDPRIVEVSAEPGALAFVDPPYLGTSGNYAKNPEVDLAEVAAFVKSLKCDVLMTYGDGAQEAFPDFKWSHAVTRKVPILRGGGTRERNEWFCYRPL